ncbi:hypothetical protein HMN09_00559900 [Mycena chlorophos]|uniref:Uncharacterized protein n=1 Tax=Mycena chlorophos TaxID=658473 RepID=A0A8H6TAZ8_MYCCL|nr:hypothetical protein HMN09_00559900 [Mycena chlorophos]
MFAFNAALLAVSIASLGLPGPANAVALPVRREQPSARLAPLPLRTKKREGFKPVKRAIGESRRSQFLKSKKRQNDAQAPFAVRSRRTTSPSQPDLASGRPGHVDVTSMANNGTDVLEGHLFANMTTKATSYTLNVSRLRNETTPLTLVTYNDTHVLLCTPDQNSDDDILCATYDTQPDGPEPLELIEWLNPSTNDGSLSQMFAYNKTSRVLEPEYATVSYDDDDEDVERRQDQPVMSATLKFVPASPTMAAEAVVVSSSPSTSATSSVVSSSSASATSIASSSVSVTTTTVYLSSSSSAVPTPAVDQAAVSSSALVSTTTVTVYSSSPSSSPSAVASSSASSFASASPSTDGAASASASSIPSGSLSSSSAQPSVATQSEAMEEAVLAGGAAPRARTPEAYAPWW